MIKQGVKNFFRNLKFVFTPLGVLALGVVLGLSVFFPLFLGALRDLAHDVAAIAAEAQIDLEALVNEVFEAVTALDWSDPLAAAGTILQTSWLTDVLNGSIASLLITGETVTEEVAVAVSGAMAQIAAGVALLFVCIVLSVAGGYLFTKWLVRRTMAKRAWWKYFPVALLDSVLSCALILCVGYLQTVWSGSVWIGGAVSLLLVGVFALVEAYLVHGRKKVPFQKVVSLKNVGLLFLTDAILFVIGVALMLAAVMLTNAVAGLFLAVPIAEILFLVIGLNAEGYVSHLAAQASSSPAAEEETAAQENAEKVDTAR